MGRPNRDPDVQLTRRQSETARAAIQVAKLVRLLEEHASGERKMTPTQVTAAKVLLAKRLPDEQRIETSETPKPMPVRDLEKSLIEHIARTPKLRDAVVQRFVNQGDGSEDAA